MLYETDFESIERFVAVSEMDFRYVGSDGRDHIKIYSMPKPDPLTGYFEIYGGGDEDRVELHNLTLPDDLHGPGGAGTTFSDFSEFYAFDHVDGTISDFNLVELSSGEVLGKLSSIETIQFADDYSTILMELTRNAGDGMTITGTYGSDDINGTLGDDIIYGRGGNDNIYAGDGNDQIYVQDENIEG